MDLFFLNNYREHVLLQNSYAYMYVEYIEMC